MQVEINHPHAKAIAAFFNGRGVRIAGSTTKYYYHNKHIFCFDDPAGYDIESEVVFKYSAIDKSGNILCAKTTDPLTCRDSYSESALINKVCKRTYTDGMLTALELVEIDNV